MKNYLDKLPQNILNKIILYNSHPIADLYKQEFLDDHELDNGSRFNTFYSYCIWKGYHLRAERHRRIWKKAKLYKAEEREAEAATAAKIALEKKAAREAKVEAIQNKINIIRGPTSSASSSTQRIELIENKSRSFWNKQTISVIKAQAELRGYIFTDLETNGGAKFKEDYLYVLFEILKI